MNKNADRGLRIADWPDSPPTSAREHLAKPPSASEAIGSANPQSAIRNPQSKNPRSAIRDPQSANEGSAIRNPQSIELRIEEMVIHGFEPDNRERFAAAVESELARLIGERGIPGSLTESVEIESSAGGAMRVRQDEKSETTGRRLARAIYAGMMGGLRR